MKRTCQRSEILSFCDLTEDQQETATEQLEEQAEETTYVLWNNEPLPLSMFMRTDSGLFHGVYGQSAFSAYLIRLSRSNDAATVVYAHW